MPEPNNDAQGTTFLRRRIGEDPTVAAPADPSAEASVIRTAAALVPVGGMLAVFARGRDAADYLNRRLSNNIKSLGTGASVRACLLDSLGKVQYDLEVFATPEGFVLLAPPWRAGGLVEELEKLVFSEDCVFETAGADHLAGLVGPRADEALGIAGLPVPERACAAGGEATVLRSGILGGGTLVIGPAAGRLAPAVAESGGGPVHWQTLDAWLVEWGVAVFGLDFDESNTPLDANLRHAVDQDKGCYPGQETIAKIVNLGHPAHALVRVTVHGWPGTADPVNLEVEGDKSGVLTRWANVGADTLGLAMVRWNHREAGTVHRAGDIEVRVLGPAGEGLDT